LPASKWTHFPFSPKNSPFFYGWIVVAASTIGIIASIPGQTMGVGVFTDHLIEALGIERLYLSTAYMVGTITSALLLPWAGKMLDRIGARWTVVLSAAGLGASLIFLAQSSRMAHFGGVDSFALSMAFAIFTFLLIRFFGQGCLTMVSRVVVGKWFDHRRGLAAAFQSVFVAFGFAVSPLLLNEMVLGMGWRESCFLLAAVVGIGMTFLGWLFYRDNPEECGLVKDGVDDPAWRARMAERIPETRKEFTRREAIGTLPFWVFNIGVATQSMVITAVTFHLASLGGDMGLTREEAYTIFLPMAAFSIVANFAGGWLSDRVRLKWILMALLAAQAAGSLGLFWFDLPLGRGLVFAGYGLSGGLFAVLLTVTWPRFFGYEHLGAISGVNMSIIVFASAMGPVLYSLDKSFSGGYQALIFLSVALPLSIIPFAYRAENPQEKVETGDSGLRLAGGSG